MANNTISIRLSPADKTLLEALAYVQGAKQVAIVAASLHLYVESLDPAIRARVDAAISAK